MYTNNSYCGLLHLHGVGTISEYIGQGKAERWMGVFMGIQLSFTIIFLSLFSREVIRGIGFVLLYILNYPMFEIGMSGGECESVISVSMSGGECESVISVSMSGGECESVLSVSRFYSIYNPITFIPQYECTSHTILLRNIYGECMSLVSRVIQVTQTIEL